MTLGKKLITITIFILTFCAASLANKSVFIISKHVEPSIAQAYKIDESQVVLQGNVDVSSYNQGYGAVGCATWPEKELIFFTYENSGTIVWSSTKTLQKVGEYTTPIDDCAGIVVDRENELIYVVMRLYNNPDNLYVYSFDNINNTLVFQNSYQLKDFDENVISGWGAALDETNDLLYVTSADMYAKVYVYDTSDFSYHHEIIVSVGGVLRRSVGIAVDPARGYMYTGCYSGWYGVEHNYIVRTQLSSPYTSIETQITYGINSAPACGLAVDDDTGYVYVTTQLDDFRIYNSSLQLLDTETNSGISGPAGVAVGGWYKEHRLSITKDNNDVQNNCVHTDDLVTFKINWSANGHNDTNVKIIDYLPPDLDYYSSEPPVNDYNSTTKKYIWELGTLTGTESETFKITARVKSLSCPCGKLTNTACLEGDTYLSEATADVNACNWSEGIVYVDKDATGGDKSGTNWNNAYTDLQEAFAAGQDCEGFKAVWVASGTYQPTQNPAETDASFELVGGVDLIGHFAGFEASPDERDFTNPNNETVLDGLIDPENSGRANYIIKGNSVNDVVIDGFTIQSAGDHGIYLYDSNIVIMDCIIENHNSSGVYSDSGSLTINGSIIRNNGSNGIELINNFAITIINNWIYNNSGVGIMLWTVDPRYVSTIRNNTIYGNAYGIQLNYWGTSLIIRNCIIRENTSGDLSSNISNVNYCCLQTEHSGTGNITDDPDFMTDGLHISKNSPCKDKGDSNDIPVDETDIDGEPRIKYGQVDIGADEFFSADFDESGIVDFIDYAILANNWLLSCSGPNWCSGCDLNQSGLVNTADLKLFCDDWLWQPAWITGWMFESQGGQMMMAQNQAGAGLQKIADETGAQIAIQDAEIEQEQIVLTEADVKNILEFMDRVQLEGGDTDLTSPEEYEIFRQSLEKELLGMLQSSTDEK